LSEQKERFKVDSWDSWKRESWLSVVEARKSKHKEDIEPGLELCWIEGAYLRAQDSEWSERAADDERFQDPAFDGGIRVECECAFNRNGLSDALVVLDNVEGQGKAYCDSDVAWNGLDDWSLTDSDVDEELVFLVGEVLGDARDELLEPSNSELETGFRRNHALGDINNQFVGLPDSV
jgi:hypothetical protein